MRNDRAIKLWNAIVKRSKLTVLRKDDYMIDKHILMSQDIPVGDLIYNTNTPKFSFVKYDEITDRKYLPLGMYSYKNWNIEYKPSHDDIVFWLEDRVVSK